MTLLGMAVLVLAVTPGDGSAAPALHPVAAPADDSRSELRQAQDLRRMVSQRLRREATTTGAENEAAVRELLVLFQALQRDTTLTDDERQRLLGKLRSRLQRVSRRLERQASREALASPGDSLHEPLGQQGGRAADDDGPELVELIQSIIAPQSWESSGGPGSIYYYRPLRVMVIRQSTEVHEQVGDVLEQLRK